MPVKRGDVVLAYVENVGGHRLALIHPLEVCINMAKPPVSLDDMHKLPVWASVAYAARCARRAKRICEPQSSELDSRNERVELAIATAEGYASDPMGSFGTSVRANAAADPADDAAQLASQVAHEATQSIAAAVARAAQMAAKAAAYGCAYSTFAALYEETQATKNLRECQKDLDAHRRRSLIAARKCREAAASAVREAHQAARLASPKRLFGTRDDSAYVNGAIRDYERIRHAVKHAEIDSLEPALPPNFFGDL